MTLQQATMKAILKTSFGLNNEQINVIITLKPNNKKILLKIETNYAKVFNPMLGFERKGKKRRITKFFFRRKMFEGFLCKKNPSNSSLLKQTAS